MQGKRVEGIDFWRGAALAIILVNHIPGNVLGAITPRNFGFSDAAEGFVFLSGVSIALAYGEKFKRNVLDAAAALYGRALRLYGAHLGLTAAALALYGVASYFTPWDFLGSENSRAAPFADPARGVVGILALSHQVAYFNILPLYVVLIALAPALFACALRGGLRMLAASAAVYAAARLLGFNVPTWPEPGYWYFNPFAWQFMFALGIYCGGALKTRGAPYHAVAYQFALAFTIVSTLIVSNAFGLAPGLVDAAGRYLDWDKTDLGVVRIIDFVALAYVLHFSKVTAVLSQTRLFAFFTLLGRNGLSTYSSVSLLSALGQILQEASLASPALDVIFIVACLALLHRIAAAVEHFSLAAPAAAE
ncbi:OpgC family protein [Methylocystis sp.]|uniref:OpgC family protein n=1 Tax=Methylocystis sp. TaxID=1911079 RepID=UPI0027335D34|nr:OpgC domain-containing protein [Methylocystis sp.]MDP3552977.1 OpgC domain-containing protein [Methylocystis sp.]